MSPGVQKQVRCHRQTDSFHLTLLGAPAPTDGPQAVPTNGCLVDSPGRSLEDAEPTKSPENSPRRKGRLPPGYPPGSPQLSTPAQTQRL